MFSTEKIEQLRTQTPHIHKGIHLNNAGASLMPISVIQAMKDHIDLESQMGGYEAANFQKEKNESFYQKLAQLIHTSPEHIAWATNATDAFNKALSSIPFIKGDTILTTDEDYASNFIAFFQLRKQHDLKIIRLPNLEEGGIDLEQVKPLIKTHHPKLVAITHIPTSSGLIQDVEAIGAICENYDCWYMVDACQSAGQLPLNVQKIKCDFLSASFRKFMRGPRGGGFLYASNRVLEEGLEPMFMDLHSAFWDTPDSYQASASAKRFESWERSYALVHGSIAAIDLAVELGLDNIAQRIQYLADQLRKELAQIAAVQVLDQGQQKSGIVTFHPKGWQPEAFKQQLDQKGVRSSIVWSEYARLDLGKKAVPWAARLSPHYYNTEDEIKEVIVQIKSILC
jgi:selenocysteine lyase/cysteine desulfurase